MGQLGRYEIIEQMGTGAMGTVYRARDTALDREIGLKTIRTGVDVSPEVRQRFYREARACARLQHPNIITVFDMGEVENTAYIAMELLEGADFRRVIQERRPIPVETKLAAAIEVCDAIAHAHRHGVIHRDIKPSNLFLTNEGRTKVLDFGIARLPSSRLTVAGQILGTPNYMAPEQILGRASDGRADLFSAAVVLFEFFAYAHPFQSNFIPRRIVQTEPDSLFDSDTSIPAILEKVFARGLAKDPDQRYQTGEEFAADLRMVMDALRGNASPNFSGFQLPSQHAVPRAQPPESTPGIEAPKDQDAQEWRLSEALRLLPEFEAAIERRDFTRADAAVVDLENRLAGDVRFTEAIRLCRSRLRELDSETMAMPHQSMPPVQPAPAVTAEALPQSPPALQSPASPAADRIIDLDATIFALPANTSIDPPRHPPQRFLPDVPAEAVSPAYIAEPETPTVPSSKPARIARPNLERWKLLSIAGGAAVCAILVLVAGVAALRPVPVESSVATAVVRVASTNIYADAGAAANKIASVPGGTRLNVLRLPTSRNQQWINVQAVTPKVLRPGYVRAAELRDWQGQNSVAALALIRTLGPAEPESDQEIHVRIQELNNLASRFGGEPAAKEAQLDVARLQFTLAQRGKAAGRSVEDLQAELKTAHQELEMLTGEQSLRVRALDLIRQIDELLADAPAAIADPVQTAAAPPPPPPDVSSLLARAIQLRQDGDYQGANILIDRILRMSPGNKDARALRDKLRRAHDAENK